MNNILFLPNWTVHKLNIDSDKFQAPDKQLVNQKYWFFKYFPEYINVEVIDIHANSLISKLEKKIKFYIYQSLLAYKVQNKFDIIISHGAQSGVFLALLRRILGKGKAKHIIFDIGGMNGARSNCISTRLIQFALKSNPYIICHSTNIIENIKRNYPWLISQTTFLHFGVGLYQYKLSETKNSHEIFVFSGDKRDEETVFNAWKEIVDEGLRQNFTIAFVGSKKERDYIGYLTIKRLPYNEYIKRLSDSAFVVLPLDEYGYSYGQMSLLGAMALGKTVITTKVSGIDDYTKLCKMVKTVEKRNVTEMRKAILYQMNNFDENKNIKAREEVAKYFNEEDMANKIFNYIDHIK